MLHNTGIGFLCVLSVLDPFLQASLGIQHCTQASKFAWQWEHIFTLAQSILRRCLLGCHAVRTCARVLSGKEDNKLLNDLRIPLHVCLVTQRLELTPARAAVPTFLPLLACSCPLPCLEPEFA